MDMNGEMVQTGISEEFRLIVLQSVMREERNYSVLYGYLLEFKGKGMNQQEMYDDLEELRKHIQTEEQEDLLLDLMDFVVGFCNPKWKIFH